MNGRVIHEVSTNCELLMYVYLNGLFICYMLRARDVSNILEYKPVIDHQEDQPRIMYTWKEVLPTKGLECGGLPCARKLKLAISMLSESED